MLESLSVFVLVVLSGVVGYFLRWLTAPSEVLATAKPTPIFSQPENNTQLIASLQAKVVQL
jgi:hypothetical protein